MYYARKDLTKAASILENIVTSSPGAGESYYHLGIIYSEMNRNNKAIQALNKAGYASPATKLVLNLVYNPGGPFLPPPQQQLEADYKKILQEQFNIQFNNLYTITNMPIKRFGSTLVSKKEFDNYMTLLQDSYNENSLESVMCKNILSIDDSHSRK